MGRRGLLILLFFSKCAKKVVPRTAAFLLIELVIALAVLSFGMLAGARYVAASAVQQADTALYMRMTQCARTQLETMRMNGVVPHHQTLIHDGMRIQIQSRPINAYRLQGGAPHTVNTQGALYAVCVTITALTKKARELQLSFSTCISCMRE